jgi:hypothetical protein
MEPIEAEQKRIRLRPSAPPPESDYTTLLDNPSSPAAMLETEQGLCRRYLDYQLQHPKLPSDSGIWPPPGPAIAISPQTGAGTEEIALRLATILEAREPKGRAPWTVFDRHLVEHMLEEHHLPKRLLELMPEDRRSYLDEVLDDMMGLRPPSWELIPKLVRTVLHLAYAGHVILVGRGASVITLHVPNVFHVRLFGSLPRRIERVQKAQNLSPKEAARFTAKADRGRARYIKAHFHTRVDDDLQYDLALNTDRILPSDAAELIAAGASKRIQSDMGRGLNYSDGMN